ncbi:hypothetical protein N9383_00995 [Granulosicoccus sp.]|nr:hypothetical protein [Granulosicoccus sp.]
MKLSDLREYSQYFGVAEQILLSATNMVASIVVVKAADVRWFGIYSFIFVLCTLVSAFLSTLLHRQMILLIASHDEAKRREVFLATLTLQSAALLFAGFVVALVLLLAGNTIESLTLYRQEITAAAVFVALYNTYDLCRQYLYVVDRQIYSFRTTAIYMVTLLSLLLWVFLKSETSSVVTLVYYSISVALLVCLCSNRLCQKAVLSARWLGWRYIGTVLSDYFDQGRFRLIGLVVTWLQNQSMNPFLMWIGGPLVAGYFSLARLIVMPMAVVNQGLTASTTPGLRRTFQAKGVHELTRSIRRLSLMNLVFSCLYIVVLAIGHFSGLFDRFVPEYEQVRWFLLIWIATLLVTMNRFWIGQYFVVSMQFRFMMYVGICALAVSLTGMIGVGYGLGNVYLALLFVIVGELVTIAMFVHRRNQKAA